MNEEEASTMKIDGIVFHSNGKLINEILSKAQTDRRNSSRSVTNILIKELSTIRISEKVKIFKGILVDRLAALTASTCKFIYLIARILFNLRLISIDVN